MKKLEDLKKIHSEAAKILTSLTQAAKGVVKEMKVTFLPMNDVIARVDMCHNCPFYKNGGCTLCGCMVSVKARIKEFRCPVGKWNPEILPTSWVFDASQIDSVPKGFHKDDSYIYAYARKGDTILKYVTDFKNNKTEIFEM